MLSRVEQKWETHLDDFLMQEDLMQDYLSPFQDLINNAKTDLEKHAIMWSVENLVLLKQLKKLTSFSAHMKLWFKTKLKK